MSDLEESKKYKGIIGAVVLVVLTWFIGKGCSLKVDCVGCLNVDNPSQGASTPLSGPYKPNKSTSPRKVTTNSGEVINCDGIKITKVQKPPELAKVDRATIDDPALMVKIMALHISDQNEYMLSYQRAVTEAIRKHNTYCD